MRPISYNELLKQSENNNIYTSKHSTKMWRFFWHYHPSEIEIFAPIVKVDTESLIGDYSDTIKNGYIFLIPPNLPHSFHNLIVPDNEQYNNVTSYTIKFDSQLIHKFSQIVPNIKHIQTFLDSCAKGIMFYGESSKKIFKLVEKMASSDDDDSFDSFCMLINILTTMCNEKEYKVLSLKTFRTTNEQTSSIRMNYIVNYIHSNIKEQLRIDDIANVANMSVSNMCDFFKKSTSKTIISYINELRIADAAIMLIETDKTILEIAYESGYQTISHFNNKFKKYKKQTPTQYRKSNKTTLTPSKKYLDSLSKT